MADLNPIGSEKLQGMDKINRILEIARYNESSQNITESKTDYSIQLADGNYYGIVNEKNGYIVKKGINESELDYIEPMKNRKYYKSYSQAMKKINLLAGELNRIHEHTENINLIGEQKKFVLKTPESETPPPPPAPEAGMSDLGGSSEPSSDEIDLDLGMEDSDGGSEELDLGIEDSDLPPLEGGESDEDGDVSFKLIQKLTGKLGQKLRTLESNEGMSSISAVNLDSLSEEDLEDVLANFEEDEEGEFDTEIDLDSGDEELDLDLDMGNEEEPTGDEELGEGYGIEGVVDEVFGESKVDKVLSKYFVISEEEKKETETKSVMKFINEKVNNVKVKTEIKEMSETLEQQLTSEFIMKENKHSKFLGKTNKNNLVFEVGDNQVKVSPNGELL
jgi:hypothetical protein